MPIEFLAGWKVINRGVHRRGTHWLKGGGAALDNNTELKRGVRAALVSLKTGEKDRFCWTLHEIREEDDVSGIGI